MATFAVKAKKDKYEIKINQTFLSRLPDAADWQLKYDGKKGPHRAGHDQATGDEHLGTARQHQF